MGGTREGARRAVATTKRRYGKDFYKDIGSKGGSNVPGEKRVWAKYPEKAAEAARLNLKRRGWGWRKTK